ncbi:MAG: EAL and HDOD domain-containing protein [Gemmatimonadota bacterium]
MNAPEHIELGGQNILGSLAICYAPLIDKHRKAIGTRLTMLSMQGVERLPVGNLLIALNEIWPEASAPVLVAPLDADFDASAHDWDPPKNAVLEVSGPLLRDPVMQALTQEMFRDGKRLAVRGRSEVALTPALLSCFEYALIHINEDRRVNADGTSIAAPAGASRRLPFIITGVQTVADVDAAFGRGAVASVGWPLDDAKHRESKPLQPGQATVLELLRLVRDDSPVIRIEEALKRDPAIAFKLLRLVNSAAFGLPVQIKSFQHAVMMLGYKKMMRWLSLLLTTASKDANTYPLMHASIRRGLFLEYIGGDELDAETRDELFITGAFSLLDRIVGAPFEQLLELIALPENVVDAIQRREGPHAAYLSIIEAIERSDPIGLGKHLDELALAVSTCNEALLRALAAANTLDADV